MFPLVVQVLPARWRQFVTRDISKVNIMSSQGHQLKTGASLLARNFWFYLNLRSFIRVSFVVETGKNPNGIVIFIDDKVQGMRKPFNL